MLFHRKVEVYRSRLLSTEKAALNIEGKKEKHLTQIVVWLWFRTEGKTRVGALRCENRLLEQRESWTPHFWSPNSCAKTLHYCLCYNLFHERERMT